MISPRLLAERLSAHANRRIGIWWGEALSIYFVVEYPKSGGTWLARMVSDYLQIPFPQFSLLPVTFSCVVHDLRRYHPGLRRVFYLYRDGRDVMSSLYFDRLRIARHSDRPGKSHIDRTYSRLLGRNYDPRDVVRHLPRFIEFEFARPGRGSPINWRDHIAEWYRPEDADGVTCLSYEDLRRDCVGTLSRAIETITGKEVDPWGIQTTVEKMSMRRQTGREPGQVDASAHARKAIVGDWRNCFSREAAEMFDELAGATLVRLGYERDRNWVDRYDYPVA